MEPRTVAKILFFGIIAWVVLWPFVKSAKLTQQRREEEEKCKQELKEEMRRLLKSGFVSAVSDAMEKFLKEKALLDLNYHIAEYKYRPQVIVDEWKSSYAITTSSGGVNVAGTYIEFQKLGYSDLNRFQIEAFECAFAVYSEKWKMIEGGILCTNEEYWIPYVAELTKNICDERGIPYLKTV